MFTKEIVEDLSKFLGIEFIYIANMPNYISSIDNNSYIEYDSETKEYDFLLEFNKNTSFFFEIKSLNHKYIYEAMKKFNEGIYLSAMNKVIMRKKICYDLKKKI